MPIRFIKREIVLTSFFFLFKVFHSSIFLIKTFVIGKGQNKVNCFSRITPLLPALLRRCLSLPLSGCPPPLPSRCLPPAVHRQCLARLSRCPCPLPPLSPPRPRLPNPHQPRPARGPQDPRWLSDVKEEFNFVHENPHFYGQNLQKTHFVHKNPRFCGQNWVNRIQGCGRGATLGVPLGETLEVTSEVPLEV